MKPSRLFKVKRQQFVSIDDQRSDSLLIKQGVPQGSVLGPALFLLFVNDIPLHLTDSTVDIYTDNTTITASAHFSDLCSMTQLLISNLDVVQRWASCNKMFINKKKPSPFQCTEGALLLS